MRRIKNILAVLLLVLFTGYYAGITLFPHVHRNGGHTVVHSHPFTGTADNPQHSHSSLQLQLIGHLSLLVLLMVSAAAMLRVLRGLSFTAGIPRASYCRETSPLTHGLRAPPLC